MIESHISPILVKIKMAPATYQFINNRLEYILCNTTIYLKISI